MKSPVNRVICWVFNTDLRNGHDGLALLAMKEAKFSVADLKCGQFVLFLNRRLNAMKIYTAGSGVFHHKNRDDRPYNFHALQLVPQFMKGAEINYDLALKTAVTGQFEKMYPGFSGQGTSKKA